MVVRGELRDGSEVMKGGGLRGLEGRRLRMVLGWMTGGRDETWGGVCWLSEVNVESRRWVWQMREGSKERRGEIERVDFGVAVGDVEDLVEIVWMIWGTGELGIGMGSEEMRELCEEFGMRGAFRRWSIRLDRSAGDGEEDWRAMEQETGALEMRAEINDEVCLDGKRIMEMQEGSPERSDDDGETSDGLWTGLVRVDGEGGVRDWPLCAGCLRVGFDGIWRRFVEREAGVRNGGEERPRESGWSEVAVELMRARLNEDELEREEDPVRGCEFSGRVEGSRVRRERRGSSPAAPDRLGPGVERERCDGVGVSGEGEHRCGARQRGRDGGVVPGARGEVGLDAMIGGVVRFWGRI
ncbi:hypothetical protein Tco_0109485 [Tanacetum coccineum]